MCFEMCLLLSSGNKTLNQNNTKLKDSGEIQEKKNTDLDIERQTDREIQRYKEIQLKWQVGGPENGSRTENGIREQISNTTDSWHEKLFKTVM